MNIKVIEFTQWLASWLVDSVDNYVDYTDVQLLNAIANNTLYLNYLVYSVLVFVAIYVVLHILKDIAYLISNAMKG
jgi:hypothetical protein